MARLTTNPPLRPAKGDASTASRGMPEIHRSTPHVIPADAGNQRKTKHAVSPPFAPRRGTRAQRAGGCPKFTATPPPTTTLPPSPQHPLPQQRVPSPASHLPPPPRGRLRGGPRVRATGRPWGAATTQTTTPSITATTPSHTTPSFPSFPIFRILVQVFPKVPQFQNAPFLAIFPYFPTQHLTRTAHLY